MKGETVSFGQGDRKPWKRGVLVTNAFLRTGKFTEHYDWLEQAAGRQGIALSLLVNSDLLYPIGWEADGECRRSGCLEAIERIVQENDFVLYWDKDIPLGRILQTLCERRGIPVWNSVEAIALCDNKVSTYQRLWEWNLCRKEEQIPLLPTIAAPMTYGNVGYTQTDFVRQIIQELGLPMVIKECCGSFGMQVYLAESEEDVLAYTKRLAGTPFLYQKYLRESSGQDVRLQVVGDKVVAAMYRFSETGDFRANITSGGNMKAYVPTVQECQLAVRTVKALGLDFAGVDLLFSKGLQGGADVVCEANSNAHFKNIHTCTGVNVADCIMEYIAGKLTNTGGNGCTHI